MRLNKALICQDINAVNKQFLNLLIRIDASMPPCIYEDKREYVTLIYIYICKFFSSNVMIMSL